MDSRCNLSEGIYERGMESGFSKGQSEGRAEGILEIALEMLREHFPVDPIARITKLDVAISKEAGRKHGLLWARDLRDEMRSLRF